MTSKQHNKNRHKQHRPNVLDAANGGQGDAAAQDSHAQERDELMPVPQGKHKSWIPAATLIIGVVVAIIYFFQLRAMLHSNEINREALQSVQRAFVSISSIEGMQWIEPTTNRVSQVQLSFIWQNSGTTPAKNLHAHVNQMSDAGTGTEIWFPKDFTFPDYWGPNEDHAGTPMFVGPNKGSASYEAVTLSAQQAEGIFQKKESLYFWGWARYHDTFPGTKEHIFKFCSKLVGFTADPLGVNTPVKPELVNCKRHNCYDDECEAEN
jgi:predicted small secreted protein